MRCELELQTELERELIKISPGAVSRLPESLTTRSGFAHSARWAEQGLRGQQVGGEEHAAGR